MQIPTSTDAPQPSSSSSITNNSTSSNTIGIFGVDLSFTYDAKSEAPLILFLLTSEIERQARSQTNLDLYKLYRTKIPLDNLIELRDVLNTTNDQLMEIDLTKYEIQYLVSIMKRFLRELPDPLVPVEYYDRFINILKQYADKSVIHLMHLINNELPEHHRMTLKWIMAHLCRICCMQFERGIQELPLPLVQCFCHIFLRPMWPDIVKIVYNTPEHIRIMEMLLLRGEWDVKLPDFVCAPALPPRKNSSRIVVIKPSAVVSPQPHISTTSTPSYNINVPYPTKPLNTVHPSQENIYTVATNPLGTITNTGQMKQTLPVKVSSQQKALAAPANSMTPIVSGGGKVESMCLQDAEWYWVCIQLAI